MKNFLLRASLGLFLGISILFSADSRAAETGQDKDPFVVGRAHWMQEMRRQLPPSLCQYDQEILTCYPISENECRQKVVELLWQCMPKNIPDSLDVHRDGIPLAEQLGSCIGDGVHERWAEKRKSTYECQNRNTFSGVKK